MHVQPLDSTTKLIGFKYSTVTFIVKMQSFILYTVITLDNQYSEIPLIYLDRAILKALHVHFAPSFATSERTRSYKMHVSFRTFHLVHTESIDLKYNGFIT